MLTFGKASESQLGLGDMINMDPMTANLTKERIRGMVTAPSGDVVEAEIMPHVYMPPVVPGLPPIADLSVGGNHTFAIDREGAAWRWEFNGEGQSGTGDTANDDDAVENVTVPMKIDMSKSKSTVVAVACGAQHLVIVVDTPAKAS